MGIWKLFTHTFWGTYRIWIISLQGGLGPTVSEVMPISICSPKSMGKKLPNELWARPVASKLFERRPLTFFHRRDTENGQKWYFSAFLQITPMQKFSGGIPGCQMKADIL